jgi:hypothetical protein
MKAGLIERCFTYLRVETDEAARHHRSTLRFAYIPTGDVYIRTFPDSQISFHVWHQMPESRSNKRISPTLSTKADIFNEDSRTIKLSLIIVHKQPNYMTHVLVIDKTEEGFVSASASPGELDIFAIGSIPWYQSENHR